MLLLFECFDFLGYKRTLVLLTEMYYNIISRKEKGLIILREMDRNAHSVFLHYHLVMVVKYHRKVIDDQISDRAKNIFEYISPKYGIVLEEWNHDQDHVNLEPELLSDDCGRSTD